MKDLISNDKATNAALAERLKRAQSHSEYQWIQCVLIHANRKSSPNWSAISSPTRT